VGGSYNATYRYGWHGQVSQPGQHIPSLKAVEESDLLLIVLDVKEGLTPADREIIDALRPYKKPYLIIINKVDNPSRELNLGEFYELGVDEVIPG
jgi:GTP-binding protein